MRIDQAMMEQGLVESRTRAQDLIQSGVVYVRDQRAPQGLRQIKKSSEEYRGEALVIGESPLNRYVSRAGLKLEAALNRLGLDVADWKILDVGQSTGGFTDCLIQREVGLVVGIEVGSGQLHASLRVHPKVQCFENTNIKDLQASEFLKKFGIEDGFDLAVIDVSFISLAQVIPAVLPLTKAVLALVKPQFEVGPKGLEKGGIVRDKTLHLEVEKKIKQVFDRADWQVPDYFPSELEGKDGNQEYFIWAYPRR